jgi:hypothetical protein
LALTMARQPSLRNTVRVWRLAHDISVRVSMARLRHKHTLGAIASSPTSAMDED